MLASSASRSSSSQAVAGGAACGRDLARPEPQPAAGSTLRDRREALAGDRDRVRQVRREQPRIAEVVANRLARQAVKVDAQAGGRERLETLGEERPDRP